jgi:hypothetical protein
MPPTNIMTKSGMTKLTDRLEYVVFLYLANSLLHQGYYRDEIIKTL